MRFIYNIILLFNLFFLLVSCETNQLHKDRVNELYLNINCNVLSSRATVEGVTSYNENKINKIDCFFYPIGSTFDTKATFYYTKEVQFDKTGVISITFDSDELQSLFGGYNDVTKKYEQSQCLIYIVANMPDVISIDGDETINELKSKTITSNFLSQTVQSEFVMDSKGDDKISLSVNSDNSSFLTGNVQLYRAAAKIMLNITDVVDSVEVGGDIYRSQPQNMSVYMHRGVSKSNIDNNLFPYISLEDDDFFSFSSDFSIGYRVLRSATNEIILYEQQLPFYSYPSDWNEKAEDEMYFTLVVPWKKDGEAQYNSCYYQIPINSLYKNILRNHFYKINLSVGILGSFEKNTAVTVNPSYVILDIQEWNKAESPVSMQNLRYLMVKEKSHELHNIEELYIPYVTSNECEIIDVKFEKYNVSGGEDGAASGFWETSTKSYTLELDETGNIYYHNTLDNNYMSPTFDFTPYRLTFTIHHKDDNNYSEEITILQYPAIYADAFTNSDYTNGGDKNGNHGFMFVNGYTSSGSDRHNNLVNQDFFCSAPGLSNEGASPNMYVFTITSVQGLDYVIGDPRTNEIDTELRDAKRKYRNESNTATAWQQAPALYDGAQNRGLRYYYPTDVDYTSGTTMQNSRTRNMIAPKFRIASAYAVLHTGTNSDKNIDGIRKRCASYQEDGYPAGRWRIPTEAEFKFILSQVNKDPATLPQMYIKDNSYWCAHGVGTVQGDGSVSMNYTKTSTGHSVRCVYDEWYWGSEQISNKSTFTWGDMPR